MNGGKFYEALTRTDLEFDYSFTLSLISETIHEIKNVTTFQGTVP